MRRKNVAMIMVTALLFSAIPFNPNSAVADEREGSHTVTNPTKDGEGNSVWDCVYFGEYYQNDASGNTKEPIKWRVLSVDGNDAYLLSEKALDVKPWNETQVGVTWENCTLRSWLNGYTADKNICGKDFSNDNFINTAFTSEERDAILSANVVNQHDPFENTPGGNDTVDKVYLLSHNEAMKEQYGFLPDRDSDDTRILKLTPYVNAKLDWDTYFYLDPGWWLRSHGDDTYPDNWDYYGHYATYVFASGFVYCNGSAVDDDFMTVRPVLHLNLQNTDVYTYAGTVNSSEIEEETTPEETTPEETTPEETTPEETTPEEITSEETTPEEITSEETTPEETTPEETTLEETTPEEITPEEITSEETTSEEITSEENNEETSLEEQTSASETEEITTLEKTTTDEVTTPEDKTNQTTSVQVESTEEITTAVTESTTPEVTGTAETTPNKETTKSDATTYEPGKVQIKKVVPKKKSLKKLKIVLKKKGNVNGYVVAVLTKKKAKKILVKKTVKKTKVTIKSKKLKNKKRLFVKARTYIIDTNGKKVYGAWSKVKRVKIKK